MSQSSLTALLESAELKLQMFDIHILRAMNYRKRIFEHHYMMTYVRAGSAKLRIGDSIHDIRPGSVIVIPPHLEHDQYMDTDEETEFLWWHFTYKIHNRIEILPFLNIPYIYTLKDREQFEKVFDEIMRSKVQVTETSDVLGFNDLQTFTRLFKKYTGITPKPYKTALRNSR